MRWFLVSATWNGDRLICFLMIGMAAVVVHVNFFLESVFTCVGVACSVVHLGSRNFCHLFVPCGCEFRLRAGGLSAAVSVAW